MTSLFAPSDLTQPICVNSPIIVDSFAGGGGASTGLAQALGVEPHFAINHDPLALSMHAANHPSTTHLITSVYAVDPRDLVKRGQRVGVLWASPDCTHFSKARGGKPVSKNIRSLAWVVVHWIETLGPEQSPDVILLENVEEFQTWEDFQPWVKRIKAGGYKVEFRVLRSCDYGAPTIRRRLYMVARKDGRPIVWPAPTHGDPKSPEVQSGKLKPWKSAGSIIDWSQPMPSIFMDKAEAREWWLAHRHLMPEGSRPPNRPLAYNTQARIAKGIKRYVLEAEEPYFVSFGQHGGGNRSAMDPIHTITASTKDQNQLVATKLEAVFGFMAQHNGGVVGRDLNLPLSTITTRGTQQQLVAASMVQIGYGERKGQTPRAMDIRKPLGTIVASSNKHGLVAAHMVNMRGSGDRGARSLHDPLATVTAQGNHAALVAAFMVKFYGTAVGANLWEPCHTLTAKDRFALVTVNIGGEPYVITDICMRMLTPREQFNAQGFPRNYVIDRGHDGRKLTRSAQTKKCGNSVSPPVARALAGANCAHLYQ